jgi:hypothetical protein
MMVVHNAVQTYYFASHLKPGHLIPTILRRNARLEKPGANSIEACELLTIAEKGCATLYFSSGCDQIVNAIQFFFAEANRHAQFPQITVRTGYFDGLGVHDPYFGTNLPTVLISVKFSRIETVYFLMNIKNKFNFSGIFETLAKEYS